MSTKWISTDEMSGAQRPDIPLFWLFYFVIDVVSKNSSLVKNIHKNNIYSFNIYSVTYLALEFTNQELFLIVPADKKTFNKL